MSRLAVTVCGASRAGYECVNVLHGRHGRTAPAAVCVADTSRAPPPLWLVPTRPAAGPYDQSQRLVQVQLAAT